MTEETTVRTCSCCGRPAAACDKPVRFENDFRYWIIRPDDPGEPPGGDELVHAATNDTLAARLLLNALNEAGTQASGWDNVARTWFVTPELMEQIINPDRNAPQH